MDFHQIFRILLTETGSRAEKVLEGIWQHLLPWQCFKYFSVLNFYIEKGVLLNQCPIVDFYPVWPRLELGDYEMPSLCTCMPACMCVCMHVCIVTFLNQAVYRIHL